MEIIRRNSDYALRALVHLGLSPGSVHSCASIASEQEVPVEFLQKILQKFVKAGLVVSHRGVTGGFELKKPAAEVSVLEVISLVQGPIAVNRCLLGEELCEHSQRCHIKQEWVGAQQQLVGFLRDLTVQDLVDKVREARSKQNDKEERP